MLLRALPGKFQGRNRLELPRTDDPQDPARRAYILWRQQRLFELWRLWDAEVRTINPDSCVIPNNGGGALSSLDMQAIGALAPMLVADRQARRGLAAPWAIGKTGKEYRATLGRKPVIGLFSVGLEEAYRWKDSVQSDAEIRIWALDGIANGMRPWFTKFSGTLHDQRWLKGVEDIYLWAHKVEPYLRHETPLARVALVYSQQTAWFYGGTQARPKSKTTPSGGIRRWSRRASRSRWCTTGCSMRRTSASSRRSFCRTSPRSVTHNATSSAHSSKTAAA